MNTLHVNFHYLSLPVYYQPRRAEEGGESELSVGGAATSVERDPRATTCMDVDLQCGYGTVSKV